MELSIWELLENRIDTCLFVNCWLHLKLRIWELLENRIDTCLCVIGTKTISSRCSKSTHSSGSFSKRIARSLWKPGSRDGRSERSRLESRSFTMGITCVRAMLATWPSPMCSTKRFWRESTLKMDCFRIWISRTSSWGFLRGFLWCVWC